MCVWMLVSGLGWGRACEGFRRKAKHMYAGPEEPQDARCLIYVADPDFDRSCDRYSGGRCSDLRKQSGETYPAEQFYAMSLNTVETPCPVELLHCDRLGSIQSALIDP
jgi:hypothetical protein